MTVVNIFKPLTIVEFQKQYFETRFQFHEGEVWEVQATTFEQSYLQGSMGQILRNHFNRQVGGPGKPGGWWLATEVAVRCGNTSLFSHDLAGWRRSRLPERPKRFPVTARPDWVCEILSSNSSNDRIKKKRVLHENEVPFY